MNTGRFPSDNLTAGISDPPTDINGKYVLSVTNAAGVLQVAYGGPTIAAKHLPAACR
jgi:hypothetical protein